MFLSSRYEIVDMMDSSDDSETEVEDENLDDIEYDGYLHFE